MVDSSLTDEMILMLDLPVKPDVGQALQGLLRLLNLNASLPTLEVKGPGLANMPSKRLDMHGTSRYGGFVLFLGITSDASHLRFWPF